MLLDYVQPGDLFVGDRGYSCKYLFAAKKAHLYTPPPKPLDGAPLSEEAIELGRVIASARVHIERFNDR